MSKRKPTSPSLPFDEPPRAAGRQRGRPRRSPTPRIVPLPSIPRRNVVLEASAGTGRRACSSIGTSISFAPASSRATSWRSRSRARPRRRCASASSPPCAAPRTRADIEPTVWTSLRDHLQDVSISTIDAFCLSLLREFPLEADLDPGFGMADETEALRLVDESLDRTLRICRSAALSRPVGGAGARPSGRMAIARGPSRPDRSPAGGRSRAGARHRARSPSTRRRTGPPRTSSSGFAPGSVTG